jgi:UDP-N-acetylglucosamine 1-carboxyvinyltransferase
LKVFEALGAKRLMEQGDIILQGRLRPARIALKFPSVGATENLMMAAALVPGTTRIVNAAREPEIEDLGKFLNAMGADVRGAGRSAVEIRGGGSLRGARHRVIPDRIEAGTFLLAVAAAKGRVRLTGARGGHLKDVVAKLRRCGARIKEDASGLIIEVKGRPRPVSAATKPYPGFPTDLQAPWLSLMCLSTGTSAVRENVFENRFMHAAELARMGALIDVSGSTARILGISGLKGAPIMASDLRAGAALLVAALAAKGRTTLARVYHIDRGYEKVEVKLRGLGARIRRAKA